MAYPYISLIAAFSCASLISVIVAADNSCDLAINITQLTPHAGPLQPVYDFGALLVRAVASDADIPYSDVRNVLEQYAYQSDSPPDRVTMDAVLGWARTMFATQKGYSIVVICALAFVTVMPLIGLIFACCRCCGRCGGKRYQDHATDCGCCTLAFLCTTSVLGMLVGIVVFALTNQKGWTRIPVARDAIDQQLSNAVAFNEATVDQLQCRVDGVLSDVRDSVLGDIYRLPSDIANKLIADTGMKSMQQAQYELENVGYQLLPYTVSLIDDSMTFIFDYSRQLQKFSADLSRNSLEPEITEDINQELKKYVDNGLLAAVKDADERIRSIIADPKHNLTLQLREPIARLQEVVGQIRDQDDAIRERVVRANQSIQEALRDVRSNVKPVNRYINQTIRPEVRRLVSNERLDSYTWVPNALLVVVFPIFVIILLIVCGMLCGFTGCRYDQVPYKRRSASNHGGNCMMAAVALCFVFSSLLMLITLALFSVSYASQEIICKPVFVDESQEMFELADEALVQSGVWNEDNYQYRFKLYSMLMACKHNNSVYNAFNLSQIIDLDKLALQELDIEVDPSDIINVDKIDVYRLPGDLSNIIRFTIIPTVSGISNSLKLYSRKLDHLPTKTLQLLEQISNNSELTSGERSAAQNFVSELHGWLSGQRIFVIGNISVTARRIDDLLAEAQRILSLASSPTEQQFLVDSLTSFARRKVANLSDAVRSYAEHAVSLIQEDVGSCRPLYDIFQNSGVIACKDIISIAHGLWLSLGWCLLWFIPTIFWATCLAKFLHRMNEIYYMDHRVGMSDAQILDAYNAPTLQMPSRVHPAYPSYRRSSKYNYRS